MMSISTRFSCENSTRSYENFVCLD